MEKREWIEDGLKNAGIGLILFFSAVFSLLVRKDMIHLQLFSEHLSGLLCLYVLGAVAVRGIFSLPIVRRASVLFQGAAIVWWIFLFALVSGMVSALLPEYIHNIVLMNIVVLLCIVNGNYLYLRYVAKTLNRGAWKQGFVLIEDLRKKPKNEDEFMENIYQYCSKNALDLNVIRYGMPAYVEMDAQEYEVKLTEYCGLTGEITYALEFVLKVNES